MTSLHQKFIRGIRWNATEKLLYNPLYFAHYTALFKVADQTTYGLAGTIFASIYLINTATNLGLNNSMGGFFDLLTKSKKNFLALLIPNLIPQAVLLTVIGLLLTCGFFTIPVFANLHPAILIIIMTALVLESIKKKFKTILQLAFKNKVTALSEVGYLVIYLSLFWAGYLWGIQVALPLIFVPLIISTGISGAILGYKVFQLYQSLPDNQETDIPSGTWTTITVTRGMSFFHEAGHLMFSSNFLVPLFAIYCGFEQAGIFTLINSTCYSLTSFFQKILGEAGGAYLSHVKKESVETKHAVFVSLLNLGHHILIAFMIFISINYTTLLRYNGLALSQEHWLLIPLFLLLSLSENFFLIFEKFFITQNKPYHLFVLIISNALLLAVLYLNVFQQHPTATLLFIIGLRVTTFVAVSFLAFMALNHKPRVTLQPRYLMYSLFASLGFFLMMR